MESTRPFRLAVLACPAFSRSAAGPAADPALEPVLRRGCGSVRGADSGRAPGLTGLAAGVALMLVATVAGAQSGGPSPQARTAQAAAPVTVPQTAPQPVLVHALMGVLGKSDLLQRFADTCSRTLPTAMGRYMDAADGWQRRNGDTVGQATRILSGGLSPEHARLIAAEVKRIGDREFAQVTAATMHQRVKWCDSGVDEIRAGKLDVFNNPTLTRPLNSFGRT